MIIRVRTQIGTWRIKDVNPNDTFAMLRTRVENEHKTDLEGRKFSSDIAGKVLLNDTMKIKEARLENGAMIYVSVNVDKTIFQSDSLTAASKIITKDGNIQTRENEVRTDGFRPGLLPLRSMKMHWTLSEFVDLDNKFGHKVKRQEEVVCKKVSLDTKCVQDFQSYMRTLDYAQIRVAYLYGTIKPDNTVKVEFIYEPPQESTDIYFQLLENTVEQEQVDTIASYLQLSKVGCIIAHPPREEGFYISGYEVMFIAEQQLICSNGLDNPKTAFVTVKITLDIKTNNAIVEGFQVSTQCMELVAENVIQPSHNLGKCTVQPTFTVIQEGKPVPEVDNNFFLTTVPIEQHDTVLFVSTFPRANRNAASVTPSVSALKQQIQSAGKKGFTFIDMLADVQLLLYICKFLDMKTDMVNICNSIINRDIPLDDGYMLLIKSIAGIEM